MKVKEPGSYFYVVLERFLIECRKELLLVNYSEVKPKPIVGRACTFSSTLCWLHVITLSFDWFTGLSPSFLIGQSNYFGFGFTTLI